ncbi:MAG: cyclic nucleotide-binding and patatin-like phospholipase domain-containing protein [Acidimicrobiales bacterium]
MAEHRRSSEPATIDELKSCHLFADLDDQTLRYTAERMRRIFVPAEELVITAGATGDALFVVVRGRLQVFTSAPDGVEVPLNEAGPGDVVGELALLSHRPRLASVRTTRDSELLRLSADDFDALVDQAPAAVLHIARTVVDHLDGSEVAHEPPVRTIALLPAGGTDPRVVAAVAMDLASALGPKTVVLDAARIDQLLGPRPATAALLTLLDRCEREGPHVIYVGNGRRSWVKQCTRQADRIVLVADATARPEPNRREVAAGQTRRELLLVHPADCQRPEGTIRWLEVRNLAAHHHVRRGDRGDMERVARLVTGNAVGLVLGGGGPRGFAHMGVIRALEDAGVPIDMIGGTSIGALMAAGKAVGWDHSTRMENVVRAFAGKGLFRPTLPLVSLTSGKKVTKLLRDPNYLGETAMEDFWIRWFCVSTNLTRSRPEIHERGPAWLCIRSSIALPGILPPVFSDGDLLVDGGVLNNVPVDAMRERLDGRIIAVDLEPDVDLRPRQPFPPSLSGWRMLADRLLRNGSAPEVPNAVQILMRAKQVGGEYAQRAVLESTPVDLYLRPPMDNFGALNFGVGPQLVESAYRYTLDQLEQSSFAD